MKRILGGIFLSAVLALTSLAARADDVIRFGVAENPIRPSRARTHPASGSASRSTS